MATAAARLYSASAPFAAAVRENICREGGSVCGLGVPHTTAGHSRSKAKAAPAAGRGGREADGPIWLGSRSLPNPTCCSSMAHAASWELLVLPPRLKVSLSTCRGRGGGVDRGRGAGGERAVHAGVQCDLGQLHTLGYARMDMATAILVVSHHGGPVEMR